MKSSKRQINQSEKNIKSPKKNESLIQSDMLIVDDSRTIRTTIRDFLEEIGFTQITEAEDGEQALNLFNEIKPEIVFLDLHLPKISGEKLAKHFLETDPYTKIIVVSAEEMDSGICKNLLRLGAYEYFEKPLRKENLIKLIDRMRKEQIGLDSVKVAIPSNVELGCALLEYSSNMNPNQTIDFFKDLLWQFERVMLFTFPGTLLYNVFAKERNVELCLLSSSKGTHGYDEGTEVISINELGLITDKISSFTEDLKKSRRLLIFDNLTSLILEKGFTTSYSLLEQMLMLLSPHKISALFILNIDAHQGREVAAVRGVMSTRINLHEGVIVGIE